MFRVFLFFLIVQNFGLADDDLPRLSELVNPLHQFQLRDILSTVFDLETSEIQSDSIEDFSYEFTDRISSISEINRSKRDLLFQGDIQLSRDHLANIVREQLDHKRRKRTAFRDKSYPKTIWKPYVPYTFHKSLKPAAKKSLMAAISFWETHTCVKFRKRTKENVYLVMSGQEDGCWSTVGRDESQKAQILNIGDGCEMFGVTSHELAHALGLFHEQSRYDRDANVQIIKKRVAKENFYDFAVVGPNNLNTYGMRYDIGSVMHYRPNEFSKDGKPSIIAKDSRLQNSMGQFRGPSFLDVAKINKHYQCGSVCENKMNCENGGYQNPRNCKSCVCPPGFGGQNCTGIEPAYPEKCQGELQAGPSQRKFTINMRPKKNVEKLRKCNYHIKAPRGKRIVVIVDSVIGNCVQGCYEEGVELKLYEDKTATGARFCCKLNKPQMLISHSNLVVVMLMAGKSQAFVQLRYSYVDIPQSRSPIDGSKMVGKGFGILEKFEDNTINSEEIRQNYLISNDAENKEDFEFLLQNENLGRAHDF